MELWFVPEINLHYQLFIGEIEATVRIEHDPGSRQMEAKYQSIALKLNSPPSLMPEGQRDVTVLVRV